MPASYRKRTDPLEEQEYFELDTQFQITPPPAESTGATGLHYQLHYLLTTFGYSPKDKWDAYAMAENLLGIQYVENGHYVGVER